MFFFSGSEIITIIYKIIYEKEYQLILEIIHIYIFIIVLIVFINLKLK